MRLKPVPEPPAALDDLRELQRAVPLVPGSTDDCCARLRDRCGLPNRRVANDWLAFLRALGLARETPRGFVRTEADPTPTRVREGLREGVLLVPEALAALRAATTADPLTADALFESTRESVPRHDRARDLDWEATWRDRADRLLRWLALVELARPVPADADGTDDPAAPAAYVAGDAAEAVA
ncbi:hypothetical protein U4E84_06605 [Halorubrum sp. AD140]|uniref:hypothetical protein n=1 Tax=Halorubrum sp. AD140 TaxID=3050073 RepID=UPI002ACCE516|nr:hypothetical protein [Halorubrum sp. AD140]MDZ5811012.1 hypothetical protein [Halorubrum sp. AD140]